MGLVAGVASGMFGIGGGLVVVPALVLLTDLPFRDAVAASLLFMCFTTPVGVWRHGRAQKVDFQTGFWLAGAGLAGVGAGHLVGTVLDDQTLVLAFAILLTLAAQNLAYGRLPQRRNDSKALVILVGFVGGFVAKLFGIGGGIVMVPGLVFTGVDMKVAIGTSLFVVFTNAVVSSGVNLLDPGDWIVWAIPVAVGAFVGIQLGAIQSLRTHGSSLKRWFAALMVCVALQMAREAF